MLRLEWYTTATMEGFMNRITSGSIMVLLFSLVIVFSCMSHSSSAFLIVKPWNAITSSSSSPTIIRSKGGGFFYVKLEASNKDEIPKLTHADIQWKLEPPEDMSLLDRMQIKAAAKAIHTECILKGSPIPPILCPKGGKATLAGYINGTYIHTYIYLMVGIFSFGILIHLLFFFFKKNGCCEKREKNCKVWDCDQTRSKCYRH